MKTRNQFFSNLPSPKNPAEWRKGWQGGFKEFQASDFAGDI